MTRRFTAAVVAGLCLIPTAARAAETPTPVPQLAAYNLDWLAYLDPADQPPNRMAVCIVDTGIAITPDTPPDNPNGPILRRLAVDGGSGEPQDTGFEYMHGTRTAYSAIAPQNGWGTVGVWPGGVAIGVRASADARAIFMPPAYRYGISKCLLQVAELPIAVIELALNCSDCNPSEEDLEGLRESIGAAHDREVSVVAAAGNQSGGAGFPASAPGVFAVTEGDGNGTVCPHAASEPKVDLLVAPGCPSANADPFNGDPLTYQDGGTSTASSEISTLIAFLRSSRPDAGYLQAERWLRDGGRVVDGVRVVDGEAAARRAGLGAAVDRARVRRDSRTPVPIPAPIDIPPVNVIPAPISKEGDTVSDAAGARQKRMQPPTDGRIRWANGKLHVTMPRTRPLRVVRLIARNSRNRTRQTARSVRRFTWNLPFKPRMLSLTALATTEFSRRPSKSVIYRLAAGRRTYAER